MSDTGRKVVAILFVLFMIGSSVAYAATSLF